MKESRWLTHCVHPLLGAMLCVCVCVSLVIDMFAFFCQKITRTDSRIIGWLGSYIWSKTTSLSTVESRRHADEQFLLIDMRWDNVLALVQNFLCQVWASLGWEHDPISTNNFHLRLVIPNYLSRWWLLMQLLWRSLLKILMRLWELLASNFIQCFLFNSHSLIVNT